MANRAEIAREGQTVIVPISPSGFARAVIARADGEGRAFGYFFGPRLESADALTPDSLDPKDAILVCKFGDHGIYEGKWQISGEIPHWDRKVWKLPKFTRRHDRPEFCYLVEYDDNLDVIAERVVPKDAPEIQGLPYDAQLGSGVVETKLANLLL